MIFRRKNSRMAPTRKDSVVISGAGPTGRVTVAPTGKNPNHDRAMSALNNAIQTLKIVQNVVPVEIAKGVLASVAGILDIVKNALVNQDDFQELAEQCQTISLLVWRATFGIVPEHQINTTVECALSDLKSSIDRILHEIESKTKENVGSKIFHAAVNQASVAKWRNELGRALDLFNTKLNISTNLKLDELLTLFNELGSSITSNAQADPEVLPVRPKFFVGRDDLVWKTTQPLLQCGDVALIGPGGIGKSSIARAILNEEALISKFRDRRFFVRYDDLGAAQITFRMFLDRIATALGLPKSANPRNSLNKALLTSEILLVLDNAETFLGASSIVGAIDEFDARPNVAILLTTRTKVLPPNLSWVRLEVPPLKEDAACEAFKLSYTPSIETSVLVKLLSAIDFHPLSINLLAQAAVQNEWSPQDLVDAWDRQRVVLLEAGDGKIQSLAITIETSLKSPSITDLGDTICYLLQIIAFLPQGIDKKRLTAMFPGVSDIEFCANVLCKQSLIYLNGDFITLLAPIRLYISQYYNVQVLKNPLLEQVRQYYAAHADEEGIVSLDNVNMEHVFSHWVVDPECMVYVLKLISDFVYTLLDCRPRPVSLYFVVSALDPDESRHSTSCMDSLKVFAFGQSLRRLQVLLAKGSCLFAISTLLRWIGQIVEAEETLTKAREVLLETGRLGRIRLIGVNWGVALVHTEHSNYQVAEELLQATLKRLSAMFRPNRDLEVLLRFGLAQVKICKGDTNASKDYFKALLTFRKVVKDPNIFIPCYCDAGYAELHDGRFAIAKNYFNEAKASVDENSIEGSVMSLLGLAEVADCEGDHTEAKALRARALEFVRKMPNCTVPFATGATAMLAGYLAMEGSAEQAREMIVPAVMNASKHLSQHAVRCKYMAGVIDLIHRDFDQAQNYFQEIVEECVLIGELRFWALSERALGEVAVVKGDLSTARKHFEATIELCKSMGLPKEYLYRGHTCYIPNETFNGWKLYQEECRVLTDNSNSKTIS